MQVEIAAMLFVLSSVFASIAAWAKDRNMLVAAGVTMLFVSGFVLTSGVEYQDGFTELKQTQADNDTEITHTPTYTSLSEDTGYQDANVWLAVLGIGTSLYMLFQGVIPDKSRKSSVREALGQ